MKLGKAGETKSNSGGKIEVGKGNEGESGFRPLF